MPIVLALSGVRTPKREDLIDLTTQYFSERLCLAVDPEHVKNELAHLFLSAAPGSSTGAGGVAGILQQRLSASTALEALEALAVQAVRGAADVSSRYPTHPLVRCFAGQPCP